MDSWDFEDLAELAWAVSKAGDCFIVRRALERLERGEIGVAAAIKLARIAAARPNFPASEARAGLRERADTLPVPRRRSKRR